MKNLLALLIVFASFSALRAEEARLYLEQLEPIAEMALGDTLEVGVYIDAGNLALTSASIYLSYDPAIFDLVPSLVLADGRPLPFASADFMAATVYENSIVEGENTQLSYIAVSGVGAAGDRAVGSGRGLLASVRLRTVGYPAQGVAKVSLEAAGQHQPSYTILGEPGVERRFYASKKLLYQQVKAEGLLGLPDVNVEEGETITIDLAAHFLSAEWSAADLRWQANFRGAGAGVIAVEGTTLLLMPAVDAIVDYAVETPDGARMDGEFAVRVAQKERYLQGGAIYMMEDGGFFRRNLAEYLIVSNRAGEWSVRGGERVVATIEEDQLEVTVPADWAGEDVLELSFCVGAEDCETLALPVVVQAQNDAPTALAPPTQELVVGQRLTWPLQSIFADIDDALDELVVSLQSSGAVALYAEGGELVVEALEVGEERVLLRVEDPQGLAAEAAWQLRVSAPSAGPRFLAQPPLALIIDEEHRIDLSRYVEDKDTPFAELVWELHATGVEFSWAENEPFILLARGAALGATTAYLSVRDPEGSKAVAAWAVEVVEGATDSVVVEGAKEDPLEVVADTTSNAPSEGQSGEPAVTDPATLEEENWSIASLGSASLRLGEVFSVSLQDHLIGRSADEVTWSVEGAAGLVVELVGGAASLRAADSFTGKSVVLFYAVDEAGQRRSAVLEVEVEGGQQVMVLGDIPDVEMAAGTTQYIELSDYADRPVSWSISGGEEIEIRIVEDVAILRAAVGFYGRSVVIFRAADSEGNSAVDVVRIEVRADDIPGAAAGDTTTSVTVDSSATSGENGDVESSPPAPETGNDDVLQLGVWPDYVVELGVVASTPVLDELVVSGDAAAVQWSLRGGAFVVGAIDAARRVVLDASAARIGREVFLLTAQLGAVEREVVLGVEVRAPAFELLEPPAAVLADENGYELAQLVRGTAPGIEWQLSSAQAAVRLEAGRLFVDAEPGSYEVLVTGRSASGVERQIALCIDVAEEQEEALEPESIAPDAASFAPHFVMPTQLELAAGASARWPLVVLDEDSAREELLFALVATGGGGARIEGGELVLQAGAEDFSVHLRVRDSQGNEGEVFIEVLVRAVDSTPPEIELAGDLAAAGLVRWTVRADEELGAVLLLVDGQPLPIQRREEAVATWLQVPTGEQQVVRVVASDLGGNTAQKEIAMSAGPIGDGFALQSADGRLRALGGVSATPALLYAEDETYRLDFTPGERVEIALLCEWDNPGLLYGDGAMWRELGAALSADNRLLRAVISAPGWLRAERGQDLVIAAAAAVYPNPFNATTAIRLYMPTAGFLRAVVYDALGRRVRVLAEREHGAGAWTLRWHGRDERGNEVASGVYFVEIEGPDWRQRARMLLLR